MLRFRILGANRPRFWFSRPSKQYKKTNLAVPSAPWCDLARSVRMNRREALTMFAGCGASLAAAMAEVPSPWHTAQQAARRGLPPVKITDVKVILTQMESSTHYVIVKVLTSEPGLYGLGCATHAERPLVVATAVEQY